MNLTLRPPEQVMRLKRMGSNFPTRLSFMRTLLRRLAAEQAVVSRPLWEISDTGFGRAVYSVTLSDHRYSLVAFSTPLDASQRTDRVIAEAWDSSYVLFDGEPTTADLDRLEAAAPAQEAARYLPRDLVLSRANRSVRLFDHVVERLASGRQPDDEMIASVGYLMRTTAVYGNGKFGIADRGNFSDRPGMADPFRAEMLTVWLIREFTHDLVEHIAEQRSPETFTSLDFRLRRHLGIGNSTGLGMAPFLVSHPVLINNWMMARETALARVRAVESPEPDRIAMVLALLQRARHHVQQWNVNDPRQTARIEVLRTELAAVEATLEQQWFTTAKPWERLLSESALWSLETQELIVALLLEPHGDLVDDLASEMSSESAPRLDPAMSTAALAAIVRTKFAWALDIDFTTRSETMQFWYVSEEKLEPRLGRRYEEPGADLEQPLDIARQVQSMYQDLADAPDDELLASFLARHPEHRFAAQRVQNLSQHPYAEIQDNLIGEGCLPIDMLRSKLSFFGASKFDPRSDRWTRITLYQGAPLAAELAAAAPGFDADAWWLPVLECS